MKRQILFIFINLLFITNSFTQAMIPGYQAINYLPTFITGGMTVRYEISNSNSYSETSPIIDLIGNANATIFNNPSFNSIGTKSLNFSSSSSNYLLTTGIGSTYNQSIFMWIYPTGNGVILSELGQAQKNASYHDSNIEMVAGVMKFSIWNSTHITSNIVTPLNTWYYVGMTYDGTTLTAYINGVSVGSTTLTRSPPGNLFYAIGAHDATSMGDGGYGNFKLYAFHYYKRALSLNEVKLNYNSSRFAPDGLTESNASTSAYQIKLDYPNSTDGFYWIKNAAINGGVPFKIFADMTSYDGGWTLILKNSSSTGWTYGNAISLNASMPFTTNADVISTNTSNYSIIGYADAIKKSNSGFQYMIDATTRGRHGGIWTANGNYSFVKKDNSQTDVTINTVFGNWTYVNEDGIMKRMPWYSSTAGSGYGVITTDDGNGNWWGTLISLSNWSPTPWISNAGGGTTNPNPGIIWYWVR